MSSNAFIYTVYYEYCIINANKYMEKILIFNTYVLSQ